MDLVFRNYNSNKISSIQRRYLVTFWKGRWTNWFVGGEQWTEDNKAYKSPLFFPVGSCKQEGDEFICV
jgi:hypothetical protein